MKRILVFVVCMGVFSNLGLAGELIISWSSNPPADSVTSYSVFRSVDSGLTVDTYWWGITDTFYVDSSLQEDISYTYWVKAYNKNGASPPSNFVYGWRSSNDWSIYSGELRLLTEPVGDSLEVRWSVGDAVSAVLQYDFVDGEFTSRTGEIPGAGPYSVMIPATDTVRVSCWSGDGEYLTIYAPIAVAPPDTPEVKISPF